MQKVLDGLQNVSTTWNTVRTLVKGAAGQLVRQGAHPPDLRYNPNCTRS